MDVYMSPKDQEVNVAFRAGPLIDIVISYHHTYVSYSATATCDDRADCIEVIRTDWNGNILPAKEETKNG